MGVWNHTLSLSGACCAGPATLPCGRPPGLCLCWQDPGSEPPTPAIFSDYHFLGSHLRAPAIPHAVGRSNPVAVQGTGAVSFSAGHCYWSACPPGPQAYHLSSSGSDTTTTALSGHAFWLGRNCPSKTSLISKPWIHITSNFLILMTHYHKRNAVSTEDELQLCFSWNTTHDSSVIKVTGVDWGACDSSL